MPWPLKQCYRNSMITRMSWKSIRSERKNRKWVEVYYRSVVKRACDNAVLYHVLNIIGTYYMTGPGDYSFVETVTAGFIVMAEIHTACIYRRARNTRRYLFFKMLFEVKGTMPRKCTETFPDFERNKNSFCYYTVKKCCFFHTNTPTEKCKKNTQIWRSQNCWC